MVSAVKWEGASVVTAIASSAALDGTTNNAISGASSKYDNEGNLNTLAWFELNVTYGSSPTDAVPTADLYMQKDGDSTNFESAPVTGGANQGHMFALSFPVRKVTAAQRVIAGPILLPPFALKFYLDSQAGTDWSTGATLDIITNNLEGQ